ncbi:hypothetical protein LPJ75_004073 [Coemansia sp. RSA 2598]|nr:hypothetical protein LPJ75_004073 [Coemansia sp. RSA 2598]
MDLACSLIRSRQVWLTEAFSLVSPEDSALPRTLVDAVEVQIGPHIFPNTRFYLVAPAPDAQLQPQDQPPPLAFEFAEAPGDLLCLPKDLGIDRKHSGKQHVLCYFYAHPTNTAMRRSPSLIRQHWPHYYSAEKNLVRINLVVRGAGDRLLDCLLDYADAHRTAVWRQYRESLCHPHPTARFCDDFLPLGTEKSFSTSDTSGLVRVPSILKPQQPLDNPRMSLSERAVSEIPRSLPSVVCIRGGKGGYDLAAARANMQARQNAFEFMPDDDASDDAKEENSQMPDTSEQVMAASSESESGSSRCLDPPRETKAKRPAKRGPYKRRTQTKKKPQRSVSSSAMSSSSSSLTSGRSRVCKYCGCKETPIWRRGPAGTGTLCNACGVKWKLGKILK